MKKTILAIAVLISSLGISSVSAQYNAAPGCPRKECCRQSPEHRGHHGNRPYAKKERRPGCILTDTAMFNSLNLTPQQKAEVFNLCTKRREANSKAADKMKESRLKAAKSFDKGLEKVLTPAQLQQYRDNASRCRSRRADGTRAKKRGDFRRFDCERPDFCPLKAVNK